jgi:uncharacterized protein (DUF697 family)
MAREEQPTVAETPTPDPSESPTSVEGAPPLTGEEQQAELSQAVTALTDEDAEPADRRRSLGRLIRLQIRQRGVKDLFKPKQAVQWIADSVSAVAPYIAIRDLETLRRHHDGLDGDALADRLIRNASRVTAAIGAAGGGVAAVEWTVTPALLSAPVLLASETVAVVAVELKLIGELHAVYGQPIEGSGTHRAVALVQAWAHRKGVNPFAISGGVAAALGTAARKELRERLIKRVGRNLTTFGPFLTGAAVAGFLNRRSTVSLGEEIQKDLKRTPRVIEG